MCFVAIFCACSVGLVPVLVWWRGQTPEFWDATGDTGSGDAGSGVAPAAPPAPPSLPPIAPAPQLEAAPPAPGLAMGLLIAAGLVVCGLLSTGIVCCVVKPQARRHADSPLQTVEIRRGGGINLTAQGAGVDPTAAKV